ncbi:MAG TPA: hypothetical protein VFL71_17905 [Actinomycetes bacterium]|nr:hypothetical protein [Actinomycetes bacterium]
MGARRGLHTPPDPYERLQAARKTVKALQDERSALAVRLAELARGGDADDLETASARLDTLPGEVLRAELRLARADHQAARATLQAAEASLGAVRTGLDERGPADAGGSEGSGAATGGDAGDAAADPDEPDGGGGGRLAAEEQWVRDCRLAVERAERRARELQAAVDRTPADPGDETVHRGFAKRVAEARDAIERARTARHQAELDLIQTTELARVALDGLADAGAGADWRSLEQAREARTAAAGAVGPAWEALRWAGLRVARAEYELDRLVEERLSGAGQPSGG